MHLSLSYPHIDFIRLTQDRISGYEESQALTQFAILQQLTTFLRSGKYTGTLGTPSKIVHIGHSFGSCISNALIDTTPQLSDAAILTGIGYTEVPTSGAFVEAFGLRIATLQAPGKWPGRDNEYVTWVDAPANPAAFFQGGSYDEEVLWYTEAAKQPLAAVELLTLYFLPKISLGFTKPVLVRTIIYPSTPFLLISLSWS
jgi:pimeloyl-ACP methyl ester carboxylesterase